MPVTTDQFELQLLSAIVSDESMLKKVVGVVDTSMFSSAMSSDIFEVIVMLYNQYKKIPTISEVLHIYKSNRVVSDDTNISKFLDAIYTQAINVEFIINELSKYVKCRELENLFRKSYESVKSGDDIDISQVVSNMFKIQMKSVRSSHLYGVSIDDIDYMTEQSDLRKAIPTNVEYLNRILNGGLYNGQLGIILAPPNYGKTMLLLNFAIYAYLKGHNVLFVTLEMQEFSILKRAMMLMSGCLNMEINTTNIRLISDRLKNKFIILYKPVKSIGVDYLYSVYHQADADGIKFDVVFVDYADLLISSRSYKERRYELASVFDSLKAFSQILDIPTWSATQSNRAGLRADTVTMEHLSESIDKGFISDVILSISDKMSINEATKLFLTKHREGQSDIYIDTFVNNKMWVDSDEVISDISLDNIQ